jgi:hypothetical protein
MSPEQKHSIEVRAGQQFVASLHYQLAYALRNLADKTPGSRDKLLADADEAHARGRAWEAEGGTTTI